MTAFGTFLDDGRHYTWGLPAVTPAHVVPLQDGTFLLLSAEPDGEVLSLEIRDSYGNVRGSGPVAIDGWHGTIQKTLLLPNRDIAVVFHDTDNVGLLIVQPDMTVVSSQRVNTWQPLMQDRPAIVGLDDGGFVVGWHSLGQDAGLGGYGVYAQRFDGDGNPVGSEFRLNDIVEGNQFDLQLAAAPGGRFLAVWTTDELAGPSTDIRAQMFNANNTPAGLAFNINEYVRGAQDSPGTTVLSDGKILVTWRSGFQDGSGDGIYARLVSPSGQTPGAEFRINDYTLGSQNQATVAALGDGGFVVAWTSSRNPDGNPGTNIVYRVFDAAGRPLGGDQTANQVVMGNQDQPLIQVLDDGSFVIAWNVSVDPTWASREETAFHARRFHADGAPIGAEAVLASGLAEPGTGTDRGLWLLENGEILALWGQGADHSIFTPLDPLTGDARDNLIRGTAAAEHLRGMAGNDTLVARGNDTVDGGAGFDIIQFDGPDPVRVVLGVTAPQQTGQGLMQLLSIEGATGGSGDDVLIAGNAATILRGRGGNDRLVGGAGDDTLYGGDGADRINGGDGNDLIYGGDTDADLGDTVFAGAGNDTVFGGAGDDILHGMDGDDLMFGDAGSDTVYGGAGNDTISGGGGSDALFGGPGDDFLNGGWGFDRLNGGAGADTFFHLGIYDHGMDWIQDYNAAEGDVLQVGIEGARAEDFHVNFARTPNAGSAAVDEAFIVHLPTGRTLFALVDGGAQSEINLQIAGEVFNLLD